MTRIAPYTRWIRSFGTTNGLEHAGPVARSLGLQTALGAWVSDNATTTNLQIDALLAAAHRGEADMLIVGSEVLLRHPNMESALLSYIQRVRAAGLSLPIAYADTYSNLLAHPAVVAAVDVVMPNYYPYWEGVHVDYAVAAIHRAHAQVVAAAGGKRVVVSESGWPSGGNAVGAAVPSPDNAALFFLNFVSWARALGVEYFYFAAYDERWKTADEGPQGAHWGLFDEVGNLKPDMQAVFDNQVVADNWSNPPLPGGPGTASIAFSHVPLRGSSENLAGRVLHVDPSAYKVAVYIYVGGWWTKPTFVEPLTRIGIDGNWICDITTGGNDPNATMIAALVLPEGTAAPALSGAGAFPAGLLAAAVAQVSVSR